MPKILELSFNLDSRISTRNGRTGSWNAHGERWTAFSSRSRLRWRSLQRLARLAGDFLELGCLLCFGEAIPVSRAPAAAECHFALAIHAYGTGSNAGTLSLVAILSGPYSERSTRQ